MVNGPTILRSNGELLSTRAAGEATGDLGRKQSQFSRVLAGERARAVGEDEAIQIARDLVAVSLVQPLLKEWRNSEESPPPFGPGQAEKQFRAMQDASLAQELTRASHFPLVDRLASDLRRGGGAEGSEKQA
jgi:Rod binding domain-containing protein